MLTVVKTLLSSLTVERNAITMNVSPEILHKLLIVDIGGRLSWKSRTSEISKTQRACNAWNAKNAGKEAFTYLDNEGYKAGRILGIPFRAHRVIWAMSFGKWPDNEIDHIDGNRANNAPSNLRQATRLVNGRNQKRPKDNQSGYIGVSFYARGSTWQAFIVVNGKKLHLGYFKDKKTAIAVRAEAETVYGFHENHGRHS